MAMNTAVLQLEEKIKYIFWLVKKIKFQVKKYVYQIKSNDNENDKSLYDNKYIDGVDIYDYMNNTVCWIIRIIFREDDDTDTVRRLIQTAHRVTFFLFLLACRLVILLIVQIIFRLVCYIVLIQFRLVYNIRLLIFNNNDKKNKSMNIQVILIVEEIVCCKKNIYQVAIKDIHQMEMNNINLFGRLDQSVHQVARNKYSISSIKWHSTWIFNW